MDELLDWLDANEKTIGPLNLPPHHSTVSVHDLAMQPDYQIQPVSALFNLDNAYLVDRLHVVMTPPGALLSAAKTKYSLLNPDTKKRPKLDVADHNQHVTIQHY